MLLLHVRKFSQLQTGLGEKFYLCKKDMAFPPVAWLISPDDGLALQLNEAGGYQSQDGAHAYPEASGALLLLAQQTALPAYAEHYQRDAELFDYQQTWSDDAGALHENRRLHETILAQAPRRAGLRVLDVGCGSAWLAGAMLPGGHEVVSMDVSTVNPQRALVRYPSARHYAVVADVFNLPFVDGLFDFIVAGEVIEHVPDPGAFLAALLRVLAPGGRLVVTTPYDEKIQYCLCIHCNRPTPHDAHLHSFTANKLRSLMPPGWEQHTHTLRFMNKALLRLRTHVLLTYLNYGLWRLLDTLANQLVQKPARLMLVVEGKAP